MIAHERRILELLQQNGPTIRCDVGRMLGLSQAPQGSLSQMYGEGTVAFTPVGPGVKVQWRITEAGEQRLRLLQAGG